MSELLQFFDNAFDHNSARKEGKIIPSEGVDSDLDSANQELKQIKKEMDVYLKEQKTHFGCEVKYWGTGKNRYLIFSQTILSKMFDVFPCLGFSSRFL